MSSNFRYYREAAKAVSRGWLQWDWRNDNGEKCLVQALRNTMGGMTLPNSMIAELDSELDCFNDYRLLRTICRIRKEPLEDYLMLWNDLPWRRKQQIVEALNKLANAGELDWQQAERDRLNSAVERLRSNAEKLEAKIQSLEEENGAIKRLINASTLRADRRTLQELSDQLDSTWEEFQTLPEIPAGPSHTEVKAT